MNSSEKNNVYYSIFVCFFVIFTLCLIETRAEENPEEQNNVTNSSENTTEANITEIIETNTSMNETDQTNNSELNITETNITSTNTSEENTTFVLVCTTMQCDSGCAVCSDGSCHSVEEGCIEAVHIEKISPTTLYKGEQQLNILLKNTGTVALMQVEAEVSAYGIVSGEKISIEQLLAGEKDYTFTKVTIEKAGTFDVIVKVYANGTLIEQDIMALIVVEDAEVMEVSAEIEFNETAALMELNQTRVAYNSIETNYYEKEKKDYIVFGIDKDLIEIKEYLRQAQVAIIEQDAKEFEKNILAAKTTIETVSADLENAQKEEKTFFELLSENLALIGSLFGVLISGVTVWSMTKVHLNKAKIVNIIKGKQIVNVDKETEIENIVDSDDKKTKDL